jgi:hypothetical protein
MKITFIHYHLKTGGVTTVLQQQVDAIRDLCDILVLTGAAPESPSPCDTVQIPGLGYDQQKDQNALNPMEVAASVIKAINSKWKNGCDLVHVHNPTLAKNKNFLKILKALQDHNITLFLQVHDFAEDGRPSAYFSEDEYVEDCHYGVINSRDFNILLNAGLKKKGLHKIANTIRPFHFDANATAIQPLVVYPIRGIRRKNIGEAILLSLFFENNETLAITLPPNSPVDIESYAGWQAFATDNDLNVTFDASLSHPFPELVRSARFLITTSITEGFGFSFLEPWTAQKVLWGRKLPDICRDFENNGARLDHLYTRLGVPVAWIDQEKFLRTWQACVRNAAARFNFKIKETSIAEAFEKLIADATIDFGLLNEAFQKQVIGRVLSNPGNRDILIQLNSFLASPGKVSGSDAVIKQNTEVALRHYSPEVYRETLIAIYKKVVETNVRQHIDKGVLISEFLNLELFSLLKWGPYVEE